MQHNVSMTSKNQSGQVRYRVNGTDGQHENIMPLATAVASRDSVPLSLAHSFPSSYLLIVTRKKNPQQPQKDYPR